MEAQNCTETCISTGGSCGQPLINTLKLTVNPQQQPPPLQQQPSFGATFAPRPQPSAFSSTPILSQQIDEDEPQVIKCVLFRALLNDAQCVLSRDWREKQKEEIKARDEASKARRQETISKAERSIDEFYDNYSTKKERNIGDNKCVISRTSPSLV